MWEQVIIMINNYFNYEEKSSIIKRFENGEINIKKAFSLLMKTENENTKNEIKNNNDPIKNNDNNLKINCSPPAIKELDRLVGLTKVKKLIREYISFLKVQELRKNYNLKNQSIVMHMIFKGNPGTGKTTVARIIGKIFNEIGFLEQGEMIEAERADLVGEYIGHTAQKTKEMVKKAIGGVLFIDEAYALARGGKRDFGKEAIDTLVKAMEDHRENLIIILAGYKQEMDFFLKQNPGLRSRISIHLNFPDYSVNQLVEISELMYKEREYILSKNSKHYIHRILGVIKEKEGENNGNARTVRNLVEKSIRQQARRIINKNNISRKDLMTIKIEDLARGKDYE